MNKLIICYFTALLMAAMSTQAQSNREGDEGEVISSDTTVISWRKKEFIIVKDDNGTHMSIQKRDEYDWEDGDDDDRRKKSKATEVEVFAFDLGVTNYYVDGLIGTEAVSPDLALKAFPVGSHLGLHFLPTRVRLDRRGVINLKTAITLDISSYNFVAPISLLPEQDMLTYTKDTAIAYDKNKLVARYIQIPLMLNLNTSPRENKGLKISVGGYAGLLLNAKLKQEAAAMDKVKIKDDFNLTKLRYGLMVRFDFSWLDIYVNYNISSLFEEGQGPRTQTFTAGINLLDF